MLQYSPVAVESRQRGRSLAGALLVVANTILVLGILSAVTLPGCSSARDNSPLQRAEELTRQERYEEAIEVYRHHIARRIAVRDRPEWENPYFYLLMIGDLQLRMDQPEEALASISQAEKHQVEAGLISDRYRAVASWYEHQGRLTEAMDVLRRFRSRDELLFDAMLDRLARELVHQEERAETPMPMASPTPLSKSTPASPLS